MLVDTILAARQPHSRWDGRTLTLVRRAWLNMLGAVINQRFLKPVKRIKQEKASAWHAGPRHQYVNALIGATSRPPYF